MSFLMRASLPTLALLAAMAVAALGWPSSASADVDQPRLENAGWVCFDPDGPGPLGQHCSNPGEQGGESISLMVFDESGETFHGTELLLRDDLYAGQPCPTEGEEEWHLLPAAATGLGADYRACHH